MPSLRIALAQINVTVGDFAGNEEKLLHYTRLARREEADLVAFPELALCGYPPEDLLLRPSFLHAARKAPHRLRTAASDLVMVVGFVDSDRYGVYNAAAILGQGRVAAVYHKMLLPNYGVFDEKRYFTPGRRPLVLRLRDTAVAVTICEDIWQAGGPAEAACRAGAHVVLNISASPYHAGKVRERVALARALARRCHSAVCYLNLVGGQDELVFDGGSVVLDAQGRRIAQAAQFEEQLLVADLATPARQALRSSSVHVVGLKTHAVPTDRKPMRSACARALPRWAEVYRALVLGTGDYVRKNGFAKVLIGLSGGIDSALVATIAVDALGKDNVVGVTMPSRFSSSETVSDAAVLAEGLGIRLITLPIKSVHDSYLEALAEPFAGRRPDITEENIQARIRGNFLMALSNKFGWLVLTTGNKSETSVGYCTLYGDMAGGFAVVKDVPKTWVYALAAYRNALAGRPVIPESTIERPPTAELRPNQRDQDSLPPYDVLDRIIDAYVEKDMGTAQIIRRGNDPDVVAKVVRLIDRSEYKRRQAAPGVKITPRAFGRDRRMPITSRYNP